MASWRDHILKQFTPQVARLTLVADPDGLLLEEGILVEIHARGFDLISFEDHVAFRYAYESRYRTRWDSGEQTDLSVVLHAQTDDLAALPYDLLHAGRKLTFSLAELFPNLSYPVVAALDRGDLDALYTAQAMHSPGALGENATKEFVLRHVFEIAPELIKQPSDLLQALLRRHYRGRQFPAMLDARFIELLRQRTAFAEWPLEVIVPDREAFFAFLQERWPIFLDRMLAQGGLGIREDADGYGLTISGPVDLPFEHDDIRVYIDNLFLDGLLQPVDHERAEAISETWVGLGVRADSAAAQARRLHKAMDGLQPSVPETDARHGEWLHFARRWAELIVLFHAQQTAHSAEIDERFKSLQTLVDARFDAWLAKRYAGLATLPATQPVMLHHLPRFLARQIADDASAKVALVVVDGLALDQWLIIRQALSSRDPNLQFREQALFAWIPSVTAVSRQTLFAGRMPAFFPDSIDHTEKEPALWKQFWAGQGMAPHEIIYAKKVGQGSLGAVAEALSHPKARVAGLVINTVDDISHGMKLGTAGMHNQVRQWAEQPVLSALLDLLIAHGFRIYLTSDHGNIEARGCGSPAEGSLADVSGQRVRVYPDAGLRNRVKERFPTALEWNPVGLPAGFLPLLAPHRQAFVADKECVVSHGGASVEELIVPLVQIERRRV